MKYQPVTNIISKIKTFAGRIEWPNFFFIVSSPIIAFLGTLCVMKNGGIHWGTWVTAGTLLWFSGIGVTAGYHRLFSHRSYDAHWSIRLLLLLLGGASVEGSAREWCCAHRKHHQFVDNDGDPYNIKKGFWFAHVGWVVIKSDQSDVSNIKDLLKDPLIRFQDRFYIPITIATSFFLPACITALWGDFWGGFFVAGWLRIVVNHHLTFLINSYAHYFGRQNYSDRDSSRDSPLLALFTYGEGFHNFHHTFATDFRNGIRAWHWDPAKWFVRLWAWMGLASRLRRTPPHAILMARLAMDEKRLRARAARHAALHHEWDLIVTRARQNLEQVHVRFVELKEKYQQLRKEKTSLVVDRLTAIRRELEQAKGELTSAMQLWGALLEGRMMATA